MKEISTCAIIILLVGIFQSSAATVEDLTYDATGATVTITDCHHSASGDLVIPNTIEGNRSPRLDHTPSIGAVP